jgi:hypothetical protein
MVKIEITKNPNPKQRLFGMLGFCFSIGMAVGYAIGMGYLP